MKKILTSLLIILLSLSTFNLIKAQDNSLEETNSTGYIPLEDFDYTNLEHQQSEVPLLMASSPLPSSYSLVDEGRSTPVKNQNPYGTCWAFGFMASAESNIITQGYSDNSIDLSELQLAHFAYNSNGVADPLGLITYDGTVLRTGTINEGGNIVITSIIAATGIGLVNESKLPYTKATSIYNGTYTPGSNLCYASNDYIASQVRWLSITERDVIKEALMDTGALEIAYYHAGTYLNFLNSSYYCNVGIGANHAVTLIGWDDNYSASNFLNAPPGDGAWLIKNSWGDEWGDDGYFWISYYDQTIESAVLSVEVMPVTQDDKIYQYDGSGNVSSVLSSYNGSITMANVYTSQRNEKLNRVGFFTKTTDLNYTIKIYTNLTRNKPTSGTLALTQSGSIEDAGYHTVELDNLVDLPVNSKFSIVVTQSSPNGDEFNVLVDKSFGTVFVHTNSYQSGQSFQLTGTDTWSDRSDYGQTFRIKGYTESVGNIDFQEDIFTLEVGQQGINNYTISKPGYTVSFSSSDTSIATVDSNTGEVTAISSGTATIIATVIETGNTYTYTVYVPTHIESISVNPTSKILHHNETYKIEVTHYPQEVDDEFIYTYLSSNSDVASVSDSGIVTGVSNGTATITITSVNGKTTTLEVTVKSDPTILNFPTLSIQRRSKTEIQASWNEIEEANTYILQTSTTADFELVRDTYTLNTTSKIMNITFRNSKLYYRVKARYSGDTVVDSNWSYVQSCEILEPVVIGAWLKDMVKIEVYWQGNQYYDGYEIYQSTSEDGVYSKIATITSKQDEYHYYITNLEDGDYYFKIKAYTSTSSGLNIRKYYTDYSSICDVHFALDNPTVYSSNWSISGWIDLMWDPVFTADYYTIYRSSYPDKGYKKIGDTSRWGNEHYGYQDMNISYGKTYYYKVAANYIVDDVVYESHPKDICVVNTTLKKVNITSLDYSGFNGITINWQDDINPFATRYKIYRSTSKNGTYSLIKTTTQNNDRSYTDTTAIYGKTYYYKLRAFNNYSGTTYQTSYSSIKSIKYKLDTPVITSVSISQLGTNHIEWSDVEDADLYQLEYATSSSGKYKYLGTFTDEYNSYNHANLTYGKTYYYRVRAIKQINNKQYKSSYSSIKYKKMTLSTPVISSITLSGLDSVTLKWNEVSFADSYDVYYSIYSNKNFKRIKKDIVDTQVDIDNLSYGKTYYFKVIAKTNYSGKECKSSYSKVKSKKIILATPSIIQIEKYNATSGCIYWNEVIFADSYDIYYSTYSTKNFKLLKGNIEDTSCEFENLKSGKTYYFKIIAKAKDKQDKIRKSAYSKVKSFKAS